MINLMYLVLTALLALNVSKSILDSFITVNTGLENTKSTLKEKMDQTYKQFAQLAQESPAKYGAAWKNAQQVKDMASKLINHIDSLKGMVIAVTDDRPLGEVLGHDAQAGVDTVINLELVENKDNNTHITHMMVGSEPAKPRTDRNSANELKRMLVAYRDKIKQSADGDQKLMASADDLFNFEDRKDASGTVNNWESMNFYHVPVVAGVTILSKIQTDIRTLENEMVTKMLSGVEAQSFKFNTLAAITQPQSSYVTVGGTYRANIFLGAYDNQNAPQVYICGPGARLDTTSAVPRIIGDSILLDMEGAKAVLVQPATSAGVKTVTGVIRFKPVGGKEQVRKFETQYEVAAPNLVVSPTKMNVFYRGVDNPVSVSVSGYSASNIRPSMTNGTISRGKDDYIVRPGKDSKAVVSATVTNTDGSTKSMKGMEFRVKNVPDPVAYFSGKGPDDATISHAELRIAQGVAAKMKDFDFDLKFQIVSYTVTATISGKFIEQECKGPFLSDDAKQVLDKVKTGQKVFIESVKAKGPDGTIRNLGTLAFKVI
jgi:gliding motility-associated protein GldM